MESKAYSISFERYIDIHHRQRRENTEPARIVLAHLGDEILADADGLGGLLGAGVEPKAWGGGERHDRGADAILVHQFDQPGRRPIEHVRRRRNVALAFPFLLHCQVGRRIEVIVGVDQRLGALGMHRGCRQHRGQSCAAYARQKLAAGRARRIANRAIVEQHGSPPDFFPIFSRYLFS